MSCVSWSRISERQRGSRFQAWPVPHRSRDPRGCGHSAPESRLGNDFLTVEPRGSRCTREGQDLLELLGGRAACALKCPDSKASLNLPSSPRNCLEFRQKKVTLQVLANAAGAPGRSQIPNQVQKSGGGGDRLTRRELEGLQRGACRCPARVGECLASCTGPRQVGYKGPRGCLLTFKQNILNSSPIPRVGEVSWEVRGASIVYCPSSAGWSQSCLASPVCVSITRMPVILWICLHLDSNQFNMLDPTSAFLGPLGWEQPASPTDPPDPAREPS